MGGRSDQPFHIGQAGQGCGPVTDLAESWPIEALIGGLSSRFEEAREVRPVFGAPGRRPRWRVLGAPPRHRLSDFIPCSGGFGLQSRFLQGDPKTRDKPRRHGEGQKLVGLLAQFMLGTLHSATHIFPLPFDPVAIDSGVSAFCHKLPPYLFCAPSLGVSLRGQFGDFTSKVGRFPIGNSNVAVNGFEPITEASAAFANPPRDIEPKIHSQAADQFDAQ